MNLESEELKKCKEMCAELQEKLKEKEIIIKVLVEKLEKYTKSTSQISQDTKEVAMNNKIKHEELNSVKSQEYKNISEGFNPLKPVEANLEESVHIESYNTNSDKNGISVKDRIAAHEVKSENVDFSTKKMINENFIVESVEKEKNNINQQLTENKNAQKEVKEYNFYYKELIYIIEPKKKITQSFKVNIAPKEFVDYVENAIFAKQDAKLRILYVKNNTECIVKYLLERINRLSPYATYTTLNMVCNYLTSDQVKVLIHDIFINLERVEWLVPFIYALLSTSVYILDDSFGLTVKQLLSHQMEIDMSLCGDVKLKRFYLDIQKRLCLTISSIDYICECKKLIEKLDVFESDGNLNDKIFENGLRLKLICHYKDWDFAYNEIICNYIGPKLSETKDPAYLYYLGVLGINAYKSVGWHESVEKVFEAIQNMFESNDVLLKITAFLFLKQIKYGFEQSWIEDNQSKILNMYKINRNTLETFIC
ncbi:hypothetical protein EDEG_01888 [Edhazardia aedis USNM 41457]|uniref:Uncharacterized protein n=1 Tax=Edhazardia aedis (strain USNM 41457) TaxID=1003232 RepID=J9D7M6_EDHAE|nr:hypothetical protein EDEG_01888 [Edhazardia aedis USNM 41457]|eukprot:EJW03796.1 hypothetical protein EDEG_01888 [Edhazardia aedis USNM 41457]